MSSIEQLINDTIINFIEQISLKYGIEKGDLEKLYREQVSDFEKNYKIISSKDQTKDWRKKQHWYQTGKFNECELYQKKMLQHFLRQPIYKTNFRLNIRTYEFKEVSAPMKTESGFEWTEDFDYTHTYKNITFFFNLKFVCDSGGAQTRSLREVYHFITTQMEYLLSSLNSSICFVNILEGNTSYNNKDKYNYLCNLDKYKEVKDRVFVGDFLDFISWYQERF
jgi:hypothetical protein